MRIGILGGTFNPIHVGHLILAEEAVRQLNLSRVIFIPSYLPPLKKLKARITPRQRYQMVKLAIRSNPVFEISNLEVIRKGTSYTIDTLRWLKKKLGPAQQIFFIAGSDCLSELDLWRDKQGIFKMAEFVVATRPDYPVKHLPAGVKWIKIISINISSSDIRKRLKAKKSIRYLVPDAVRNYIGKNRLYC